MYEFVYVRIFFRQSNLWNAALLAAWPDSCVNISHLGCL